MDHTEAGSMVVTESEWIFSHRHSMTLVIHGITGGHTGRVEGGVNELQTWREFRSHYLSFLSPLSGTIHAALKTAFITRLLFKPGGRSEIFNQTSFLKLP